MLLNKNKSILLRTITFLALVVFFINLNKLSAKSIQIKGIILDSITNDRLISCTIRLENTKIGTKSNKNGYFELTFELKNESINDTKKSLLITYTGYKQKRIEITDDIKLTDTLIIKLLPQNVKTQDIFVSASKNVQTVQDIPITISVLESSFIKDRAQNSLERVLQYVPGVEVNSDNISLRGSSGFSFGVGSRVALLIDGFPILAADNGDMKFDALPFYNIERIEVIKGAGSALFGTSAIGGVINIITSQPEKEFSIKSRLFSGFFLQPTYSEWEFNDRPQFNTGIDLNISQKIDKFSYVISTAFFDQEGYRKFNEANRYNLFSKMYYDFDENSKLDLTINFVKNQSDNWVYWQNLNNAFLPETYPNRPEQNSSDKFAAILGFKHIFDEENFMTIKGGIYNTNYTNNLTSDNPALRKSNANSINIEGQFNSKLNDILFLTYGINTIANIVESITYGNNSQYIYSVYTQAEITAIDNLITTIGLRFDSENTVSAESNNLFSPKLGLNYKFNNDHQIRFSAGKGFRAPSIAERFSAIVFNGFEVIPNLNLRAEESLSFELGSSNKFDFGDFRLHLDYSIFQNNFDNFIDPTITASGGAPVIQFENLLKARIRGLEFNIKTLFFESIGFETSLTLMDPVDLQTNSTLKYRSKMLWYNRLFLPVSENFQFQFDYRHKARVENVDDLLGILVNNYNYRVPINIVDFRVIYNLIDLLETDLRISMNVNNALNYYHVEMVGNLAPTRFVNFQLEYGY